MNREIGDINEIRFNTLQWYPVTFMSKSLNEVERNYAIYDKELLAIVRALEEWLQYLKGARYPISILTDHQNLKYFQTA